MIRVINREEVTQFFSHLAQGEKVTFQWFSDTGKDSHAGHKTSLPEDAFEELSQFNSQGLAVYWMVNQGNGRGRSSINVTRVRAIFADLDGAPLMTLKEQPLLPHAVIESSPGRYHAYWLVKDFPLNAFKATQKRLAARLRSDPIVCDLPRVLRVPGFYHLKNPDDPFLVKAVQYNNYPALTFPEVLKWLGEEKKKETPQPKPPAANPILNGTEKEVSEALTFIDPDCQYDQWLEIGMALETAFGVGGLTLFDSWSRGGSKYKAGECAKKFASFQSTGITLDTLFYHARMNGYCPEREESQAPAMSEEEISAFLESTLEKPTVEPTPKGRTETESNSDRLERLALEAPGLVGNITRWILDTSIKPQPILSLAVSLAAVGALKGHRVATSTNLRTNLLVLSVARSGSGKNHPMEAIKKLFYDAGQELLFGGKPVSDAGLIKAIQENHGRRLILWDEFGHSLQLLTARNAAGHSAAIMKTIMEIFSSASSVYFGGQYANHDNKMSRIDIVQPNLCVLGATTPGAFYDALSSKYAASGFLPRWLVFEAPSKRVKKRMDDVPSISDVPEILIHRILSIANWSTGQGAQGALDFEYRPRIVGLSEEAKKLFREADDWFEDQVEAASERGGGLDAVWSRASEHVLKLALTVCEEPEISEAHLRWALDVAQVNLETLSAGIMERIGDNDHEQNLKKVLRVISSSKKGVSQSELCRKTQSLSRRQRAEIISDLLEAGQIRQQQGEKKGRGFAPAIFLPA